MAPATATQDEDLLIISEDTADNSSDIDFSFSFGDDTSSTTPPATLETVQTSSLEEPVTATTEVPAETSASLWDFSFDIFSQTSPTPVSEVQSDVAQWEITAQVPVEVETLVDANSQVNVGDISLPDTSSNPLSYEAQTEEISAISPVIPEETMASAAIISEVPQTQTQEVSGAESLNDILTATIAKLALREEAIANDSSGKSAQIASIQAQIKALEEQVSALQGEISLLSAESEKISKNIEALEEMKLDPVKEHNARRAVKK